SYLTMPMSQLFLFGRPQDYGWARAEPISVVRSRNHLRIWKAPFQVNGETLWIGAATHDIGFERDQRNNGITHKIDPDIDLDRARSRGPQPLPVAAKLTAVIVSAEEWGPNKAALAIARNSWPPDLRAIPAIPPRFPIAAGRT